MSLQLNDSNILIINRDLALFFLFIIVVWPIISFYKKKSASLFFNHPIVAWIYNEVWSLYYPLIFIFVLRAFFYEMYIIPSGSMQPTMYPGDVVLVNKYDYGFKLPGLNYTFARVGEPKPGEIAVFLDPESPTKRKMIKRVIGVPGDRIKIQKDKIIINEIEVPTKFFYRDFEYMSLGNDTKFRVDTYFFEQHLSNRSFKIESMPSFTKELNLDFEVPEGHYFVMGDNRDNSRDSRYWGFVPERFLCGRANFVLFSFGQPHGYYSLERVGKI